MVTVAQHQIGEIALVPLVEETGIVVLGLLASPHIKRLVHDNQTHGVAHVQQLRSRRIMGTTDGVHTHRLQFREFAVEGIFVDSGTQTSKVVMLANAIQFKVLSIEPEACRRVKLKVTETRSCHNFIDDFAVNDQLRTYFIYIRILTRPLSGLLNARGLTIGIKPRILHCNFLLGRVLVVHFHLAVMNKDTPVLDMDRVGGCEPDMTVDATATVPTGVRLIGVIHAHCHHILTLTDKGSDIILEAGIAVRTETHLLTIHIDGRVHIDTIELEEETALRHLRLTVAQCEVLAIPADATRQGSPTRSTGMTSIEVALYGPIVRHIETTPIAVIVICRRHLYGVTQHETPVLIEALSLSCLRGQANKHQHQTCQ